MTCHYPGINTSQPFRITYVKIKIKLHHHKSFFVSYLTLTIYSLAIQVILLHCFYRMVIFYKVFNNTFRCAWIIIVFNSLLFF